MANRAELLKKIQARKAEKQAAQKTKWAKMRHAAEEGAAGIEKKLAKLAYLCSAAAEGFENLRDNLDLIQAPKESSLKVRVAAARNYAKSFKRIAEEAPEQLAEAVQEAYKSLDEIAGTLEMAADQLGVDVNATPAEEAFAEEGIQEIYHGGEGEEAPVDEEVKEGAGEAWSTDRDESGQPRKPEQVDVPRIANSGPGASGFVTDRNSEGKPELPKKVKIPQSEGGEAQTSIKDASRRKRGDEQIYDASGTKPEPAEKFVKEIPQSQGDTQVSAGKQGRTRPLAQIVPPGTPTAPEAGEFVKNIPQSQGESELNKTSSKKVTPARRFAARGNL
jgi:hypothetical protein